MMTKKFLSTTISLLLVLIFLSSSASLGHGSHKDQSEDSHNNPVIKDDFLSTLFQQESEKIILTNAGICTPFTWVSSLYSLFPANFTASSHSAHNSQKKHYEDDPVIIFQCFEHLKTIGNYLTNYLLQATCARVTGAHFLSPSLIDLDINEEGQETTSFEMDEYEGNEHHLHQHQEQQPEQEESHHHHHHHEGQEVYTGQEVPAAAQRRLSNADTEKGSSTRRRLTRGTENAGEKSHAPYTKAAHQLQISFLQSLPNHLIHLQPKSKQEQLELSKKHCSICNSLFTCLKNEESAFYKERIWIKELIRGLIQSFHHHLSHKNETTVNLFYDEFNVPLDLVAPHNLLNRHILAVRSGSSLGIAQEMSQSSLKTMKKFGIGHNEEEKEETVPKDSTPSHPEDKLHLPLIPDISIYYHCNPEMELPEFEKLGIQTFPKIAALVKQVIEEHNQGNPDQSKSTHHSHLNLRRNRYLSSSSSSSSSSTTTPITKKEIKFIYLFTECGEHIPIPQDYHHYPPTLATSYMRCSMITQWFFQYLNDQLNGNTQKSSSSSSIPKYVLILKRNSNFMLDYLRLANSPYVISTPSSFSFYPSLINDNGFIYYPLSIKDGISGSNLFHQDFMDYKDYKLIQEDTFNPWKMIYLSLIEQNANTNVAACDGMVIQGDKSRSVYLVKNGEKHEFLSGGDYETLGYSWTEVWRISMTLLDSVPTGKPVTV